MTTCEQEIPEIFTVDRGQPVIVEVHFGAGDPDNVFFSFTVPKEERPYVDDGYGQAKSKITRLAPGTYRYVIPTHGFKDGEGAWHFFGEWNRELREGYDEAAIFGKYRVNFAPEQLL